jgi:hypothetical protein
MQYFYLIPSNRFQKQVVPALTLSWQSHDLRKIKELQGKLTAAGDKATEADQSKQPKTMGQLTNEMLAFRADVWRLLVGETLLLAAEELPEIETPLESWAKLMNQDLTGLRPRFTPIEKAVLGGRDLFLGCYYRPENAGWNDYAGVCELAAWLRSAQPETWRAESLTQVPPEEREEELAYAKEWLGLFTRMYEHAARAGFVVVCERI